MHEPRNLDRARLSSEYPTHTMNNILLMLGIFPAKKRALLNFRGIIEISKKLHFNIFRKRGEPWIKQKLKAG